MIWDILFALEYINFHKSKDLKDKDKDVVTNTEVHFDFLDFVCLAMIKILKEKCNLLLTLLYP